MSKVYFRQRCYFTAREKERADGLERKAVSVERGWGLRERERKIVGLEREREEDRWLFASSAAASHYLGGP